MQAVGNGKVVCGDTSVRDVSMGSPVRSWILFIGSAVVLNCISCGYRVQSAAGHLPSGIQSLGIPTFKNSSPQFKVEQRITSAVLKEFSLRTHVPVKPEASGSDAVLLGEIRNVSSTPVTFASNTFGSAFLITVQLSVKLVRPKDAAVLWEDANFLYRERYVLNSKVTDFFSEDNPALDRLARDFATSLVSIILNH